MKKYIDMRVERTIHPAGFGAFCTERFIDGHEKFNMVYDCGSTSKGHKQAVRNEFNDYFSRENVIDLLCISHFDEDHINVLRTLIEEGKYIQPGKTTVLLPYIAESYALFKTEDEQIGAYFALQQTLTEHRIKTITVRPFTNDERQREAQEAQEISPERENQTINSGSPLRIPYDIPFWLYIPLFIFDDKVYTDIITALKTADEKYRALTQEEIDGITNGHLSKMVLGKFKKVCKKYGLTGDGTNKANMNSMMLLSTPQPEYRPIPSFIEQGTCACTIYRHCHCCCHKHCTRPLRMSSCLYTGDISLTANITKTAITKYKNLYFKDGVGLLQIPHHGAYRCYNLRTIKKINCDAAFVNTDLDVDNPKRPIFYSQMVRDFNNMRKCLYLVLKERDTILIQEIFI